MNNIFNNTWSTLGPLTFSAAVGLGSLGGLPGCGGADLIPLWAHSAATFQEPVTGLVGIDSEEGGACVVRLDLAITFDKYRGDPSACQSFYTSLRKAEEGLRPFLIDIQRTEEDLRSVKPRGPQDPNNPLCEYKQRDMGIVTLSLQFSDPASCDGLEQALERREEARRRYGEALVKAMDWLLGEANRKLTNVQF